jgi:hypothetical protein
MHEEKGGLKITGLGGGKTTKSLRLVDPKGREWTLRTIDKDQGRVIPEAYRNAIGTEAVQELGSTVHPYGALVIPDMAAALGIVVAKPEFLFVPDDPALGVYRPLFANRVCMLESSDPTPDGSDSKSTGKLLQKMVEDNDQRADQKAVLSARLVDMLVADWDRHFDQWKWGTRDTGRGKVFYPIPKDRDQALAYSDGLLVKYAARNTLPFLKGFRKDIPKVKWLNWTARDFDRAFLNQLSADQWKEIIGEFQAKLTDSVLERSVRRFPGVVYAIDGREITDKLKSRRDLLMQEGMKYYHYLSHYVNIVGSNKPEYFRISSEPGGRLKVAAYERRNRMDTAYRLYQRVFDFKDTKELRIYGLNGNDLFVTDQNVDSKIKVRIIGGRGNDTFDIKGHVRTLLYDIDTALNHVRNKSRTQVLFSMDPAVNGFEWVDNEYNSTRFPRLRLSYNTDDGLFASGGYMRRAYGFRKTPFASLNEIRFSYAFKKAIRLDYRGEFNQMIRGKDLVIESAFVNPALNNFFGLGTTTTIDKSKPVSYYQARYNYFEAAGMIRKRFYDKLSVMVGPYFYRYWFNAHNNVGKILQYPSLLSLDSSGVYDKKTYLGAKLRIDVNNLNNELFPTRGVLWNTEFSYIAGLSGKVNPVARFTTDMAVYASFNAPTRLVTVVRVGWGKIFTKNFQYFQALDLGANNYLRGFRKNRFSGSTRAYANLEMRFKLFTSQWSVMPGDFGLIAFDDVGHIGMWGQPSGKWHNSYGGGLYFIPFNMMIVSAVMGFSKEERLLNISTGARINITF